MMLRFSLQPRRFSSSRLSSLVAVSPPSIDHFEFLLLQLLRFLLNNKMVKRQKEKSYPSAREQREHSTQYQFSNQARNSTVQRRLPFDCCALTLTPYQQPVCVILTSTTPATTSASSNKSIIHNNNMAVLFDNSALTPFVLEYGKDPVSGQPLNLRQIITCDMDQDEEGRWQCPILTKPFTDHMKIVAILQRPTPINNDNSKDSSNNNSLTAHVYSYEAYQELNVKIKNYQDLISGLAFSPQKDVILLNDPSNAELESLRDINNFYHIQHGRWLEQSKSASASGGGNVQYSVTATRIMEKLQQQQQETTNKKRAIEQQQHDETKDDQNDFATKYKDVLSEDVTGIALTTSQASGSLTSTAMVNRHAHHSAKLATLEEVLQAQFQVMRRLKKKGHVQIQTNFGNLVVEVHCDIVPRTCTNFLQLAETGKYNGTNFHRLIPKFMIQGGKQPNDNNKTPDDDMSIWGSTFVDEFDDRLKHTGPGILSMANSGPATNKRQFFITFAACPHLDRKHTVFGHVMDGMPVLQAMERVPTNPKNDRPLQDITILSMQVLDNPAQEAEEMELRRLEAKVASRRVQERERKESALGGPSKKRKPDEATATIKAAVDGDGTKDNTSSAASQVGKYLSKQQQANDVMGQAVDAVSADSLSTAALPRPSKKKKQTTTSKFGDFSSWWF